MSEFMRTYPVVKVQRHQENLISLFFNEPFAIEPGQFVNIWIPGVDEKPFSVSNAADGLLEVSAKAIGRFTNELKKVKEGDFLGVRGPFGNSFSVRERSLLVGGGIGLAPLRFLAQTLERAGKEYELLVGAKSLSDVIFSGKYQSDGRCRIVTEDGSSGEFGIVTQYLPDILDRTKPSLICASGPEKMLLAIRQIALSKGVPFELSFERYMKCSIGVCGQCCLDGSGIRLCVEGPVLREEQLLNVSELGKPHRTASGKRRI